VDQGAFEVRIQLPEGADLASTADAATVLERALLEDEGVDAVFSRIGRDVRAYGEGEERSDLNSALLQVRVAGARTADVLERMRPAAAQIPDATVTMQTGQATTLGRILGGEAADVAVRIRSESLDSAHARAEAVAARLAGEPRLANVRVGGERGTPELRVEILRDRAAAYGIDPREVADVVDRAMRGQRATEYVDFDRKIAVMVRYPDELRYSRETLATLRVRDVPLRELVRVEEVLGPAEVRREDQGRLVTVYADVVEGGLDAAVVRVQDALRDFPSGRQVQMEVGGENEEMRRSFRGLMIAFVLASLLVYMVLAAQFESFSHPFTILMAVPLAVVGAVLALFVTGHGIDTMSLIGLVILVGIVDNDAIVKVDFINQARASGLGIREAILEGGRKRLRPIIMTTVTTIFGLLPMALGFGRGAELQAPMAIVVIGGLAVATLLTLVVIPVIYLLIEGARSGERISAGAPAAVPLPHGAD
jgi:HAE1 family hydrophobic/amphiphilic exporter-1